MLKKKTIEPCQKHNIKCNYNGVYWYVMDYIGGVLNPIGKMPKTQ